jgi:hypothetical protein
MSGLVTFEWPPQLSDDKLRELVDLRFGSVVDGREGRRRTFVNNSHDIAFWYACGRQDSLGVNQTNLCTDFANLYAYHALQFHTEQIHAKQNLKSAYDKWLENWQ